MFTNNVKLKYFVATLLVVQKIATANVSFPANVPVQ